MCLKNILSLGCTSLVKNYFLNFFFIKTRINNINMGNIWTMLFFLCIRFRGSLIMFIHLNTILFSLFSFSYVLLVRTCTLSLNSVSLIVKYFSSFIIFSSYFYKLFFFSSFCFKVLRFSPEIESLTSLSFKISSSFYLVEHIKV